VGAPGGGRAGAGRTAPSAHRRAGRRRSVCRCRAHSRQAGGTGASGVVARLAAPPTFCYDAGALTGEACGDGLAMTTACLEVHEVSKRYGATLALDRVSFQVHDGEVFGLLGPNGAGKTTLLSILSCLLEATSGTVRLLGRAVVPGDRDIRRL